jgi:hypothetical protein
LIITAAKTAIAAIAMTAMA